MRDSAHMNKVLNALRQAWMANPDKSLLELIDSWIEASHRSAADALGASDKEFTEAMTRCAAGVGEFA